MLRRLGSAPINPPMFFLERIQKARANLDSEMKLLEIDRQEVVAIEERTTFLQHILDQACTGDLEVLIGYNSRIPALPPWPARRRITRQPRAAKSNPDRSGRKRKRSLSPTLPAGSAKRSAYGGPETSDARESSQVDRSRKSQQTWPRSTSRPRRRSESCAPSTTRVRREEDECPSMGRTSTKSAKKGRISKEKIRISCLCDGRNVEYAVECEPDYEVEQAVINAALNQQAADLDYRDELVGLFVSIDETS